MSAIVIQLVAPVLVAVLVTFLWRSAPWQRQLLLAFGFFLLAESIRLMLYGFRGGWHCITADSETQLWLGAAFAAPVDVGIIDSAAARARRRSLCGRSSSC